METFTNIPWVETIQMCADPLYGSNLIPPSMDEDVFIELMNIATTSIEFSCISKMYKQIDGVAMGSPLGPALANTLVQSHKKSYLSATINLSSISDTWITTFLCLKVSPIATTS